MTLKVVWGISGSGDKMPETVAAMAAVRENGSTWRSRRPCPSPGCGCCAGTS